MWPPAPGLEPGSHHRHQRRIPALISTRPRRGQWHASTRFYSCHCGTNCCLSVVGVMMIPLPLPFHSLLIYKAVLIKDVLLIILRTFICQSQTLPNAGGVKLHYLVFFYNNPRTNGPIATKLLVPTLLSWFLRLA